MGFQVAYIPIGVPTYHLETAREQFEQSKAMLSSISEDCVFPADILLSIDDLKAFLASINPDLIVLQNITFANAAFASEVLKTFSCPVLLWTLREPVIDGTRLRINSLTGAYSAANAIRAFRKDKDFEYVYGAATEENVKAEIGAAIRATKAMVALRSLKMASIGHTPQGFGFGRALDSEMMATFGVTLESIEARELINKAKAFTKEDVAAELAEAEQVCCGMSAMPEQNVLDSARLYKAYKEYVQNNGIGAISSRCWPDFFVEFGTPVCTVLSLLNANGVDASCEADAYGALSMYIGKEISGKNTFFGDPVALDENESSITYWHCGMAACNLAREDTGAQIGVHPNRKIGPVMDFGCKPSEKATIFRIGRKPDGSFRFFISKGTVLDKPKQFYGASIVVQTTEKNSMDVVTGSVKEGWEPHFVVVYDDIAAELEKLARMLGCEICRY